MNELKKYIQFAIDNGYEIKIGTNNYNGFDFNIESFDGESDIIVCKDGEIYNEGDIIRIITSKDFIEAVERGYIELNTYTTPRGSIRVRNTMNVPEQMGIRDSITFTQAIAIRDNTLNTFITEILGNKDHLKSS